MNIRDLVIGGAAGATLAVIATLQFGGASATPPAAEASATPATAAAPQPAPAPPPAAAASVAAPAGAGSPSAVAPAAAAVNCPPALTAAEARKAASAAALATTGAARVDVPAVTLSDEHAKLLLDQSHTPPSLPELHARFAGEPLDPAWSQQMEAQLRQSLQDAGVQKGFELLAVECRRTLCELRLFGTGPDAGQRWSGITGQLGQQAWWGQNFSGTSSSTTGINDRSVIATLLHRKKP